MSPSAKTIPVHVAIIMDGNGRWAKERGLSRKAGHEAGAESIREALEGCLELGVRYLTLYAFSSENWNRPKQEIKALMGLLEKFLKDRTSELTHNNIRLRSIGNLDQLPSPARKQLEKTMEITQGNTALDLVLALSYGSRNEITRAFQKIALNITSGQLPPEQITEQTITDHLDTATLPDPDLLIRTSGECRLSNFLLWQLSYAEIYISQKYWPDFRKKELHLAINDYSNRSRRFGIL